MKSNDSVFDRLVDLLDTNFGYVSEEPAKDVAERIIKSGIFDSRPVRMGKWIKPTRVPDSMLDECSVCGFDTGSYTFNFCPNCGADMRGDRNA